MRTQVLAVLLLAVGSAVAAQERQVINPPGTLPGLPFSAAVRVGNVLYLSGQLGNLPGTRQLADTGIAGQTRQTFENMKAVLSQAGSSLERVFKCTVFLSNIADFAKMNEVYERFLGKEPPARSTVQAGGLPKGAKVEIDMIAAF